MMQTLWTALSSEKPLQIVGVVNPLCALMAKAAGFKAIYLSGAGVANANFGLPDLALTNLTDVLAAIRPITAACDLPLLVDADTGWGSPLNVTHSTAEIARAGASALHIEDQVTFKRCGHRDGKQLVSTRAMTERIEAACAGRPTADFKIIARTDALANEEKDAVLARVKSYIAAGADAIFLEAVTALDTYAYFTDNITVPLLANITEFGKTPLYTREELAQAGVAMALYPLTAFRAMNQAAMSVYQHLRAQGTQRDIINHLQTRTSLYQLLDYEAYEKRLDQYSEE